MAKFDAAATRWKSTAVSGRQSRPQLIAVTSPASKSLVEPEFQFARFSISAPSRVCTLGPLPPIVFAHDSFLKLSGQRATTIICSQVDATTSD